MTKKEMILEAALDEFAEKDYYSASTNSIVERAGASKGLLFHYFGSKDELYITCFNITMETYVDFALNEIRKSRMSDFFDILTNFYKRKLLWLENNERSGKVMDNFCMAAYYYGIDSFRAEVNMYHEPVYNTLMQVCDKSLFRTDIETEAIMRYIIGAYNSMSMRIYKEIGSVSYGDKIKLSDSIYNELRIFSELIKYGVYVNL